MKLERYFFAIEGAATSDRVRVELRGHPGVQSGDPRIAPPRLQLEALHEDGAGTSARVFRGRFGPGEVKGAVAVKVQRDNALSLEDCESVADKFKMERAKSTTTSSGTRKARRSTPARSYVS